MRLTVLLITASLAALRCSAQVSSSGPITINGQNGTVIQNLHITSTSGNCVTITNSTNITIKNSEIGPCGAPDGSGNGNGISISGSNGVYVYDNYIHPETMNTGCCDTRDGIFGSGGNQNIYIQGNVIAYGETNIEFTGGTNASLNIVGNFLLNPRGPADPRGQNFQCWGADSSNACINVTFQNNYTLSSTDTTRYLYPEDQEDSVNFGYTNTATVTGNFITGGHSQSGCGVIADDTANNITIENNRLLNTGQCGIGIADGTTQIVQSNQVYNTTPVAGGGNTAIYAWKEYSNPCGPTTIANNIADEIQPNGSHSGYWDGGGCSATISGNVFGTSADPTLTAPGTFAPPAIPPVPKNCVVSSPYTNNTSSGLPSCSGGSSGGSSGGTSSGSPQITSAGTASGTVGTAFTYQIAATNSPTRFGATGLPAGLTVNTNSGMISGAPTTSGTFSVVLSASNGSGSGSGGLTLTVKSTRHHR